jgi:hypothetical protein
VNAIQGSGISNSTSARNTKITAIGIVAFGVSVLATLGQYTAIVLVSSTPFSEFRDRSPDWVRYDLLEWLELLLALLIVAAITLDIVAAFHGRWSRRIATVGGILLVSAPLLLVVVTVCSLITLSGKI